MQGSSSGRHAAAAAAPAAVFVLSARRRRSPLSSASALPPAATGGAGGWVVTQRRSDVKALLPAGLLPARPRSCAVLNSLLTARTCACRAWIISGVSPLPLRAIFSSSGMACSSSVALVLRRSAFSAALSARFFSCAVSSDLCGVGEGVGGCTGVQVRHGRPGVGIGRHNLQLLRHAKGSDVVDSSFPALPPLEQRAFTQAGSSRGGQQLHWGASTTHQLQVLHFVQHHVELVSKGVICLFPHRRVGVVLLIPAPGSKAHQAPSGCCETGRAQGTRAAAAGERAARRHQAPTLTSCKWPGRAAAHRSRSTSSGARRGARGPAGGWVRSGAAVGVGTDLQRAEGPPR